MATPRAILPSALSIAAKSPAFKGGKWAGNTPYSVAHMALRGGERRGIEQQLRAPYLKVICVGAESRPSRCDGCIYLCMCSVLVAQFAFK